MTAIIAMKAKQTHQDEVVMFDTDAKAISIDNCASFGISNDKRDFITPLKKVNKKLKGLGGTLSEIYSGTIEWSIEDDDGVLHDIVIPNGLYVKESPSKLLSPQHWAQTAQDFKPRGTWCSTYHDCIQLHWNQRRLAKTVKLDVGGANIATMHTAPSYKAFHTFCTRCEVEVDEDNPIIGYTTHLIPDDKDEDSEHVQAPEAPDAEEQGVNWSQPPKTPVSFDLDTTEGTNAPAIIEDEEDTAVRDNPAAEFLQSHVGSQDAGHGKTMLAPQEAGKMPSSNLHKLLIWKSHKETLENQAKTWKSRWQASHGHRVRTVCQR
jgi:hypothetical protein